MLKINYGANSIRKRAVTAQVLSNDVHYCEHSVNTVESLLGERTETLIVGETSYTFLPPK